MNGLFFSSQPWSIIRNLKNIWLDDSAYVQYFIFIASITKDNSSIIELYNKLSKLPIHKLPIDGNDLIKLGFSGIELGKQINYLRASWVESDFALSKSDLINMVKK